MVAAAVASAAIACHPAPGLGTVAFQRGPAAHLLDLSNCRDRVRPAPLRGPPPPLVSADGRFAVGIEARRSGETGSQAIVLRDRRTGAARTVYRVRESYRRIPAGAPGPLMLVRLSGDARWIFFAIDPQGSASLAADGLNLLVVSSHRGRVHRIGPVLVNEDYLSWCGGRLVFSGGGDRLATHNKRLLTAAPPTWVARPLVSAPSRAWGSLVCAPDGRSVVVQSQVQSDDFTFFHTHWALWRVGLDGSQRQLTSPPPQFADESPKFDGAALLFVRSRRGSGALYALRGSTVIGPFASLGYNLGYYGHHAWPYAVRRNRLSP